MTDVTLDRRAFLAATGATLLAGCGRSGGAGDSVLRVGDQRGGQKVILQASGNLTGTPYAIDWSSFPNAAPLLQALNAGAVDVGVGGDAAFIFSIGSSARVKAIGAERSAGRGPVLVVRGDARLRSLADLPGKTIATPRGSVSHNFILAALERHGAPYDAVHFAFLSPQDGQSALESGAVDGWAIWDPNATLAVRRGARIVPGGEGLVPSYGLLFASDDAIATKRALLTDYCRRLHAAWTWSAAHREQQSQLMARETGIPVDIYRAMLTATRLLPAPVDATLIADEQRIADRYFAAGVITTRVNVTTGFDQSFNII